MTYGMTYYFYGGTSKLQGDDTTLRCTMRDSGITCRNRDRHGFKLEPASTKRSDQPSSGRSTPGPKAGSRLSTILNEKGRKAIALELGSDPPPRDSRPDEDALLCRHCAMARPGLEPGTPRFSVVCSTN